MQAYKVNSSLHNSLRLLFVKNKKQIGFCVVCLTGYGSFTRSKGFLSQYSFHDIAASH